MSTNSSESNTPRPGGLQSMLARLRGMMHGQKPPEAEPAEEIKPDFDEPQAAPPAAIPVTDEAPAVAVPLEEPPSPPGADGDAPLAAPAEDAPAAPIAEAVEEAAPEAPPGPPPPCPICDTPRVAGRTWCDGCGYIFPAAAAAAAAPAPAPAAAAVPADNPGHRPPEPAPAPPAPGPRLQGRYELGQLTSEREGVSRFRGLDHGTNPPTPVVIVRGPAVAVVEAGEVLELVEPVASPDATEEILPSFDEVMIPGAGPAIGPATETIPVAPTWPGVGWERNLLEVCASPALPAVLDQFTDGGHEYLVLESPQGRPLWDAWDDPESTSETRFGLLKTVAEALDALHHAGAMLEGVRPELVTVTDDGRAKLNDLSDLLPLPPPAGVAIRNTLYTAPELAAGSPTAGPRSDLYSFGAMLYALHVGRELTETDFERPGVPKPFIPRFPDIHPAFGRLMTKTFTHDLGWRFPTDEAGKEDSSGFTELIRTLEVLGRTMDHCRLEIAAWTTTGMIRTGNEDAFAFLHSVESRIDDVGEQALLLLCDGMGGYEAGELAAALAIKSLRKTRTNQKPFRALAGAPLLPVEGAPPDPDLPEPADTETVKRLLRDALKEANRYVYTSARSGVGRRGMGCTAEAVYLDGRRVIVGHVGDSRTYHLHEGRLVQMTRDQTLVNRLVELGTLSPEEAENHPRKNELQQAIGGQPDVEPGLYVGVLSPGDWVVVCSDGVSNHVTSEQFKQMLLSEAVSADMAARRLVNFVNIEGATDNATIVVVRVV